MRRALAVGCVALALASCEGRPRSGPITEGEQSSSAFFSIASKKVVELDLTGGAPETMGASSFFPLPASRTYVGLVRAIDRAARDQDASAIYVRLGLASFGFARSEELGRLLAALGKSGKPVVCHAHGLDNQGTLLALRGCTKVWLSPAGGVDSVGIASQLVFFKGALDKLKVDSDFLSMGKYKSAVEPFTRDSPSEAAKESLMGVMVSIRKSWLDAATEGKKAPKLRDALEHGPWSAQDAKDRGLVDAVGYESEALEDAKKLGAAERVQTTFGSSSRPQSTPDLGELIRILAGADEGAGGRPHVAVVPAEGAISMEGGGLLDSGGITAKALTKTLRKLAKDDSVKAVVLRIDSPGGSALASDLLWHELVQLEEKKPLIASVGGMAASGGYYMACPATKIVAERSSIVGSIGVLGGKLVIGRAVAEYGINTFTFAASPEPGAESRAAYLSALTTWDEPTRQSVRKSMQDIYTLFLDRVAKGRRMPVEKVKALAEGRIWSGIQGRDRGLVDEIGGLSRAIDMARELAKLDERAPVVVEGGQESLFETLLVGPDAGEAEVARAVERAISSRGQLARRAPPEIQRYLSTLQPLLDRETTLTALPFAVVVE